MFKVYVVKNSNPVKFRGVGNSVIPVSLARNGNHCLYLVKDLDKHDGHSPYFAEASARAAYLDRVKQALLVAGDKAVTPEEDVYACSPDVYELLAAVESETVQIKTETIAAPKKTVSDSAPVSEELVCRQCGHVWQSKTGNPQRCPNEICRSSKWK